MWRLKCYGGSADRRCCFVASPERVATKGFYGRDRRYRGSPDRGARMRCVPGHAIPWLAYAPVAHTVSTGLLTGLSTGGRAPHGRCPRWGGPRKAPVPTRWCACRRQRVGPPAPGLPRFSRSRCPPRAIPGLSHGYPGIFHGLPTGLPTPAYATVHMLIDSIIHRCTREGRSGLTPASAPAPPREYRGRRNR